jgi:hypothetical protein
MSERMRLSTEEVELIKCRREKGSVPSTELIQHDRNIITLSDKYDELKRKYTQALRELEQRDNMLHAIWALENEKLMRHLKLESKEPRKGKKRHSTSWAFAVASDWHIGELVDSETVAGLNEFNLDVAQKRVQNFFEAALYLVELIRAGTDIPVFVMPLLGDFIAGEIHEEIKENSLGTATEMTLLVTELLCDGIDFLQKKGKFEQIIMPCCFGNHGRNTKENRSSTAWKQSYEFLMYSFLAKLYNHNPRVHFKLTKSYHNYFDVFDKYKLRFHHGQNIRYNGGVGGITIPVNKAIAQWNKSPAGRNTYLDIFGHFHQSKSDNYWISNGSLIGYNAFAMGIKADYEPPRQQFFTIERDHGLTFPSYIFVE